MPTKSVKLSNFHTNMAGDKSTTRGKMICVMCRSKCPHSLDKASEECNAAAKAAGYQSGYLNENNMFLVG